MFKTENNEIVDENMMTVSIHGVISKKMFYRDGRKYEFDGYIKIGDNKYEEGNQYSIDINVLEDTKEVILVCFENKVKGDYGFSLTTSNFEFDKVYINFRSVSEVNYFFIGPAKDRSEAMKIYYER